MGTPGEADFDPGETDRRFALFVTGPGTFARAAHSEYRVTE